MIVLYALPAAASSLETSTYWIAMSLVVEFLKLRIQVRIPAGSANRCDWQTNDLSSALLPLSVAVTVQVPVAASGLVPAPSSSTLASASRLESLPPDLSSALPDLAPGEPSPPKAFTAAIPPPPTRSTTAAPAPISWFRRRACARRASRAAARLPPRGARWEPVIELFDLLTDSTRRYPVACCRPPRASMQRTASKTASNAVHSLTPTPPPRSGEYREQAGEVFHIRRVRTSSPPAAGDDGRR